MVDFTHVYIPEAKELAFDTMTNPKTDEPMLSWKSTGSPMDMTDFMKHKLQMVSFGQNSQNTRKGSLQALTVINAAIPSAQFNVITDGLGNGIHMHIADMILKPMARLKEIQFKNNSSGLTIEHIVVWMLAQATGNIQ